MKKPIFIVVVQFKERAAGYAFVPDVQQLGGYRMISSHGCSALSYVMDDMRGMGHEEDYLKYSPDGYELHCIGVFHANKAIRECRDEIIAALDEKMEELEEARDKPSAAGDDETVPAMAPCPKCGSDPRIVHPSFDGGSQAECYKCGFPVRRQLWAETDAKAARLWNEFVKSYKEENNA